MNIPAPAALVVNATPATPAAANLTDSASGSADFSNLLVEQLSAALKGLLPGAQSSDTAIERKTDKDDKPEGDLLTADPQGILPLLPFVPPTVPVQAPVQAATTEGELDVGDLLQSGQKRAGALGEELPLTGKSASASENTASLTANTQEEKGNSSFADLLKNNAKPTLTATAAPAQNTSAQTKVTETPALEDTAKLAAEKPLSQPIASAPEATLQTSNTVHKEATTNIASTEIRTHIRDANWTQDFGQKIVWLAKSDQQSAQININPPQLGPMQISLQLNGDQATALFASPHAEVRQAIEESMPRLREMLSANGISLGDANVGTQLPQQNRDTNPQFANPQSNQGRFNDETAILAGNSGISTTATVLPTHRGRGMVDLFA